MRDNAHYAMTIIEDEVKKNLESFTWHIRSLLGGDLFAVVAQKPSWPVADSEKDTFVNIIILVAEPSLPRCESIFKQHYIRDNPKFSYPVEFIGYRGFMEKLDLGDPSVVYICGSGFVLYDADGAFIHLRESVNPQKEVNMQRLDKFLIAKREGHFRNINFLLARLLNEIYMGAAAGIIRKLIVKKKTIDMDFLYKAAQWKEMRKMNFDDDLKERIEKLLNSIQVLIFDEKPSDKVEDYCKKILREASFFIKKTITGS